MKINLSRTTRLFLENNRFLPSDIQQGLSRAEYQQLSAKAIGSGDKALLKELDTLRSFNRNGDFTVNGFHTAAAEADNAANGINIQGTQDGANVGMREHEAQQERKAGIRKGVEGRFRMEQAQNQAKGMVRDGTSQTGHMRESSGNNIHERGMPGAGGASKPFGSDGVQGGQLSGLHD